MLTGSADKTARLWDVTELPDEPERVADWVAKATALGLDNGDAVQLVDRTALGTSRELLESLGRSPFPVPRWSLDPILSGTDPAAPAGHGIQRGRWDEAEAAFDEALGASALRRDLGGGARFHAARGRRDRAVEDAAQAVLACWNDPKLVELSRSDETFRDEALSEIVPLQRAGFRSGPEVWRGRGRRRASRRDWAGGVREFAEPATPVPSMTPPDLLADACLLRLSGDERSCPGSRTKCVTCPSPFSVSNETALRYRTLTPRCASGSASSTTRPRSV